MISAGINWVLRVYDVDTMDIYDLYVLNRMGF